MADCVSPAIEAVKLVCPTIWKYVKFQITPSSYVKECEKEKGRLLNRLNDIEIKLQSQQRGIGKIPKQEVEDWLKRARDAISETDEKDKINKGGCFCNICRAKHFYERIQELKSMHGEGGNYIQAGVDDLVQDDQVAIKDHLMSVFQNAYVSLQLRKNDIKSTLQEQLHFGKKVKEEVNGWLENAGKKLETAQLEVSRSGCLSLPLLVELLERKITEVEELFKNGEMYIHAGVTLVQDDHSVMKDHLMGEFQKKYRSLECRKKDIESTLREQIRFGKIIREEVNGWLENVGKKLATTHDEVNQGGGLLPPLLVELLQRKIGELNELLHNGEKYIHAHVILVKDDPATTRGMPLYAEKCYGRDTALAKISKYLNEDQVRRIAVWGMGGIGKTTLMNEIHNRFLNEAQFDKVIWVTVSSKLDVLRIQNEIAKLVDNKEQLEEVNATMQAGNVLAQFRKGRKDEFAEQVDGQPLMEEDASRRAGKTSALLQRGNCLLILDDVWEAFSDKDVGIPADSGGLKLVLTTRAADVARKMGCDVIVKLEPLSPEKALQLFLDKVGKVVLSNDGSIRPRLKPILMQIVEECDGLPLAIVTVASTMKGMSDDRYSWAKALKQLRKGTSVVEGEKDPKSMLKFSYDHLKDEKVQHCFLYCALFPEDFEIPKEQLIEYWIEEGLIDQMDTRHEMICEGHVILRKLEDNCLLESVNKYGDEDVVKMHDLIRDLALYITSKSPRFLVKARASEEELHKEEVWPTNVEKVSLMMNYDSMKEIPLAIMHLEYNMLTTLLMPNNSIVTIPEPLFMHTPGLRILDLSWNKELRSLPDSTSHLEKLTTLLLVACFNLKKVPSLSKCQALTKLDVEYSGIEEVSDGMEMLGNLKFLNLQWTRIKLPGGMLLKLSNLEHLLIKDTKIRVEDVVTLRKLEYLEAVGIMVERVEEMSILLGFMQEQMERLTSFTLQVEAPLLELTLERDLTTIIADMLHNDGKRFCHLRSDDVGDEDCDLKCLNRILVNQALRLRFLNIKFSDNVDCVFGLGFNPLQTLEELALNDLSNLKSVFDEKALGLSAPPSSSQSFLPLKSIDIERCPELKMLFSPALLRGYLQNLESISVSFCGGIEEIISFTSEEEEDQIDEKLTLPKLKMLILKDLPKLKSICSSSSVLICDSLEVLEIRECQGLNKIPLCFPQLGDAQPSSTPSL